MFGDMARILRVEGVRGLYGGITPTLIGIIPYAGISFATFETLKGSYTARQKRAAEERGEAFDPDKAAPMPVVTRLVFGGLAGLFAQSVTYPLDIVRRRIQVRGVVTRVKTSGQFTHGLKGVWFQLVRGSNGTKQFSNFALRIQFFAHRYIQVIGKAGGYTSPWRALKAGAGRSIHHTTRETLIHLCFFFLNRPFTAPVRNTHLPRS